MLVINNIRTLAADLCQQYKGGHPGTVMGAAAIGVALWKYEMRYNPTNPEWFARDRFVLSVGHACLLQYLMLHFSGYSAWTMDVIRDYHAPKPHVMAAGHPEIEFPGVEVTTGPLGQGIANAIGMAVSGKALAAQYNKEGFEVIPGKIWCMTGDGCIQEGVGQEALSMAGHWGLDNLILIYDNNRVTVDGNIDACFTEDTSAKLRAMGWHVIDVYDGSNDLTAIVKAFDQAKAYKGKPICVNIRTIIGLGAENQGKHKVHGTALGDDGVAFVKSALGFDPTKKFFIDDKVYDYFAECKPRGEKWEKDWNEMMELYSQKYPTEYADLKRRMEGKLAEGWEKKIPTKDELPQEDLAARVISKLIIGKLAPGDQSVMVGSADLLESCHVDWPGMVEFQNRSYHKGLFLPISATYLMFWSYAGAAVRMGSLQNLRWIGIATHDGLGVGEDAVPNLHFLRPADAEETVGCYITAINSLSTPTILTLCRQPVPLLKGTNRSKIQLGGYIIHPLIPHQNPKLTLVATGSEVWRAVEISNNLPYQVNVVSMPSMSHFDKQSPEYKEETLKFKSGLVCSIEIYASLGWARYSHAGCHMHTFGMSAPYNTCFEHFGFGVDNLTKVIGDWVNRMEGKIPQVGEFEDLLLGYAE
ncbi:hypothetical protein TREMEDRAFT_68833 [Tremella mesenterica DSM 1558]|uniref:uncharacterized protein n=1 Tax=Tremella mesenterica (strain ATCC 24925 / CBS 8224 / DSM 1558 / NBRC 9311 / NRRL Y-6157 / RJB 2259-6 / UBC 559-6) TaxID=578456 RepID=UPI0003F49448|nr:uncharacterized protein TREMEDRAFT_68833 [Tremella mesenterica DSM 1558]EIW68867.1 hypothetical protein TREMEDRAFT_68833 [Tremella mesenterica DSM 1558]